MATKTKKTASKKTGTKKTGTKKTTKPKIKRHVFSGKLAKPTAKTGELTGTRNQHGRRLGGAAHYLSVVLAAASKPMSGADIAAEVEKHCKRSGVAPRASGSYSNQLNAMMLEKIAEQSGDGWQLTKRGRDLWKSGKAITRTELRNGKTLSEVRTAYHKTAK